MWHLCTCKALTFAIQPAGFRFWVTNVQVRYDEVQGLLLLLPRSRFEDLEEDIDVNTSCSEYIVAM